MDVMGAMWQVGILRNGQPVFHAEEGKFDNPGLHVWDGETHVRYEPATAEAKTGLRIEIENAVNRHSAENGSNTPDFILAQFLMGSLRAFDAAVNARETWYGRDQTGLADANGPAPVALPISEDGLAAGVGLGRFTEADQSRADAEADYDFDPVDGEAARELDDQFPVVEERITGGDQDGDPPFETPGNGPGSLLRPATAPDMDKPAPPPGTRYKPDGFA